VSTTRSRKSRSWLDRVVDTVLVSEGEGRWVAYAGGYSDMVAQRGVERLHPGRQGLELVLLVETETLPGLALGVAAAGRLRASTPCWSRKGRGAGSPMPAAIPTWSPSAASACRRRLPSSAFIRAGRVLSSCCSLKPRRFLDSLLASLRPGAEERWLELEMMREELEG
jgi:ATP-binding cassette subfamily F protein uup